MANLNDSQRIGLVFIIGSIVIAGSAVGYLIGYLIDKKFQTSPWFVTIFTGIGLVIGFIQAYRISYRFFKD